MKLLYPDYYKDFECKGGSCKKSCCIGWALEIDQETYDYYQSMPGPMGERIRSVIKDGEFENDGEGSFVFSLQVDGRCPFLDSEGLCDIVKEAGPEALCSICATYPRSSFTYGDITELFFTLSCEMACALHFDRSRSIGYTESEETDEAGYEDYDDDMYEDYPALRESLISCFMTDDNIEEIITKLIPPIAKVSVSEGSVPKFSKNISDTPFLHDIRERIHILQGLDPIDPDWEKTLGDLLRCAMDSSFNPIPGDVFFEKRILLYFITRYMPAGVFDHDFKGKLLFALFCLYSIRDIFSMYEHLYGVLDDDMRQQLISSFSREVEHSEENLDHIFEEVLFS